MEKYRVSEESLRLGGAKQSYIIEKLEIDKAAQAKRHAEEVLIIMISIPTSYLLLYKY